MRMWQASASLLVIPDGGIIVTSLPIDASVLEDGADLLL